MNQAEIKKLTKGMKDKRRLQLVAATVLALSSTVAAQPACRFQSDAYAMPLRLYSGDKAFADLYRATVKLEVVVPAGKAAQGAQVTVSTPQVTLRGVVRELTLHPKRATVIGPFTVGAEPDLTWVGGSAGKLKVEAEDPLEFHAEHRFAKELRCEELSLEAVELDAGGSNNGQLVTTRNQEAPLSLSPGGPVVGRLSGGAQVRVLERRGANARVALRQRSHRVEGWIPASATVPAGDEGPAGRAGVVGGVIGGIDPNALPVEPLAARGPRYRCASPLALYDHQGHTVGALATDVELQLGAITRVQVGPVTRGFHPIALPSLPWLRGRLLANADDVSQCR
jgi:hypothetical protein